MAELRIYPNLPGVVSSISIETQTPVYDDSKPKFLLLGWYPNDQFADGTPIKFNEPYFIVNSTMLSDMFGTTEKLGLHAKIVGETTEWDVIPVVVRVGKVDIKAGAGTDVDSAKTSLAPATADGSVTLDGVTISWTGEPTWKENFVIKVSQLDGKVYVNDVEVSDLSAYGLTISGTPSTADAYFVFQYAVEPTTDDEKIAALETALNELLGLEVDYVYAIDAVLDDAGTSTHFANVLAKFAEKQSNQFKNVLAFIGTKEPASYTFSGIKAWVDNLENLMKNGDFKNGILDDTGNDLGHRLVVVAGHGTVNNVSSDVVDLASFVAAYIHKSNIYTGPINFALDGVTLLESITLEQANKLAGARITALYNKPGYQKKPMIIVGRTASAGATPLTKISSILVINEYINGLKEIADKFLGKPNSGTVRMSMQSTMQNFTNSMKQAGKIAGGTVTVEPDVASGAINALNVKAQIRAFAEIEVINISVKFEYALA